MTSYTDEELIDLLKQLSKQLNKPSPSAVDCNNTPGYPNASTYRSRFGSWNNAKSAAGLLNINKFSQKTHEDLISSLKAFYEKNKRAPTQKECRASNGLYGPNTYKDRFGSWDKALEKAGIDKNTLRSTQVSDEELLESLRQFYQENGYAPRHEDCNNLKEFTYLKAHMIYVRRFGGFTEALNLAGIKLNDYGSIKEKEVKDFISSIYNGTIILNDRSLLDNLELDIYLPELKIAIEFNGLYWHSDLFKEKNYHIDKTKKCEEKGVRLIHIFENEWTSKQDIVKSRLQNLLGYSKKVFARKCTIVELDSKTADEFLRTTHIQGSAPASIRIGLIHNGALVAVQTYCKSRFSKDCEWELLRYANALNTTVVGGASKLFKHFISKYSGNIVSYSDLRWNTGTLYKTLGFKQTHISAPNYWYFKGCTTLYSRQKFQKHKLAELLEYFDPDKTEVENMRANKYRRIFDCGNLVFKYYN